MNETQLRIEFLELHERCDQLYQAVNTLTSATSAHILRIRAYENIINDSWILTRWFAAWRIEKEMAAINEIESELRNEEMRARQRLFQVEEERVKEEAAKQARIALTEQREKDHKRLLKKAAKKKGGAK